MTRLANVRLLWHAGFWDGPISGLCAVEGRELWFDATETADQPLGRRRFRCFELDEQELAAEHARHAAFREHVGTHTDYDENGRRQVGATVLPRESWQAFYDAYPPAAARTYRDREPVGFFLFSDRQQGR